MWHIVRKLFKPGGMVLEICAGTGSTLKACLMDPYHRKFTGCDADSDCSTKMMPLLLTSLLKKS